MTQADEALPALNDVRKVQPVDVRDFYRVRDMAETAISQRDAARARSRELEGALRELLSYADNRAALNPDEPIITTARALLPEVPHAS